MEHDSGDPDKVRAAVEKALRQGANAGAAAASGGTVTSLPLDADTLQGMAVDWVASAVTDLLGAGDDLLGDGSIVITYDTWSSGNFPVRAPEYGIDHNYVQYCTDGDASYNVYYKVEVQDVTRHI